MNNDRSFFLCGIGGSGMLPLATILKAKGFEVSGSDRALDQGQTAPKFEYLHARGIRLFPQDGSGLTSPSQVLVASAAVEDTVPDVMAARRVGAERISRAQLLAELFNAAPVRIGVAGTSGKSTTTAMIAWILSAAGRSPTVMNGAVMKNFTSEDAPFASALVGDGTAFASELDESDGSIALFSPTIAVLNNIALDHKTMEELRALFGDFLAKSACAILNLDNVETARLGKVYAQIARSYSLDNPAADLVAREIKPERFGVSFVAKLGTEEHSVTLKMPGRHNVSNGMAAILASVAAGVTFADAARLLCGFEGVRRRFDYLGEAKGVSVIDDFGHNPDKIAATLRTLKDFDGRLLVMFQPHGFGPIRKMRREFVQCFRDNLGADDHLVLPEPVYFGGTVDRSVKSRDLVDDMVALGLSAEAFDTRAECGQRLVELSRPGDRIIVMGARDDSLTQFGKDLLADLAQ